MHYNSRNGWNRFERLLMGSVVVFCFTTFSFSLIYINSCYCYWVYWVHYFRIQFLTLLPILNPQHVSKTCLSNDTLHTSPLLKKIGNLSVIWVGLYRYALSPIWRQVINSLIPGRGGSNFKSIIFKLIMQHSGLDAQCEVTIRWIPPDPQSWEFNIGCHHMASQSHNELITEFIDVHRYCW